MDPSAIGRMSCNPAIGGSAKGHLVREIDALGGEMGKIADATGIHFKMLNTSKGPAVWSPRSQNDRDWYSTEAHRRVSIQPNLDLVPGTLSDLFVENGRVSGILLDCGDKVECVCLVLCSGTFLNGIMHTGKQTTQGGRFAEPAATGLTEKFSALGFVADASKLEPLRGSTNTRLISRDGDSTPRQESYTFFLSEPFDHQPSDPDVSDAHQPADARHTQNGVR
jgi:tRNA uridine 5-carboxymethylaminomethyl modification enzyme